MLLTVRNLSLAYGPKTLFRDASFSVQPKARTGLVGPNGSGKSTLLKILNKLHEADSVEIEMRSDIVFGYLPQEGIVLQDRCVIEEVEAAANDIQTLQQHLKTVEDELQQLSHDSEEYAECLDRLGHYTNQLQDLEAHKLRSKAEKILFGLGFNKADLTRSCGEFSGGWQMRIALARLLLEEPDLLMMDEPTNHLDLDSLRWLESFLKSYPGALLLISHDRALLDQLCKSTLSIEMADLVPYTGNYTSFLQQRAERQEQLETTRKSQERKIAQTERFIERFRYKASKASQVQSRIKQLDKIDRIETESADRTIHFEFPLSRKSGHTVVTAEGIHKAYGPTRVFKDFSLEIEKGDRVGVVGLNGAGKSTLARILAGREPADAGKIELGHQVDVGYFAQDQSEELDKKQSVFEVAAGPPVRANNTHIRSILGAFLFSGDDMDKPVSVLSGGEKNRLALARLLLCPANFLILDEPTNHLDMASKAVLQEALQTFPGTTFVVSHDRHFLNPVVNKILEIQPGSVRTFPGNLEDYMWKMDQERSRENKGQVTYQSQKSAENPKERRRRLAQQQQALAPLKKSFDRLEAEILDLEEKIAQREVEMAEKSYFEQGEATATGVKEYDTWKADLTRKMDQWEKTGAELEQLQKDPE
ncbi:ABC-F family ATP-binding cassette domain-containing protein [Puniceicoccales bacterium CK1056]|uniref:Probable ATP-binding protein YbiT n=1 Tax=Oceanipulchritudo coccoides TaxID=2706888 RepID=A0A6B2LXH1_9BACT|nr:ABC-F family ATP-binding cassette domain-containing protein [Oceanipulchritudo coccoides]NDV60953.1 ABC-F family ATP-binding cassette domain-containing protein [Oceanipulchritudo coccoides]